jgi:chemotaxis protein methyltransferase CheR
MISGPGREEAVFTAREFHFTRKDFRRIAEILHGDAGIRLSESKASLVYSRLVKRLRTLGVESFARYCAIVEGEDGSQEREMMLAALTTNVTGFFREPHHFAHLKEKVLPGLIGGIRQGARLRIWSAGCSTGEEPYSIALSILELMPDAADFDVRVLATDINPAVLALGVAGHYDEAALAPVSRKLRSDWFVTSRGADGARRLQVGEALRTLVAFRRLNLLERWPMTAAYQAIFCRNVLIYFDDASQLDVHQRMAARLAEAGRLYLGAAERVRALDRYRADGVTVYRLKDAGPLGARPGDVRAENA